MKNLNTVFYKDSIYMKEVNDDSVHCIITSPPYFSIKDYSKDGKQERQHSKQKKGQIGDITVFDKYVENLLLVWKECERVLTGAKSIRETNNELLKLLQKLNKFMP